MLTISYALWAYSVPVAFGILALLILRMALHKLPPVGMAASSWLALGPIGTGALAMMVMGGDAPAVFGAHGLPQLGAAMQTAGVMAALLLWGFGLWWLLLAMLITARYFRNGVPFNLGWWGYTFPLGVYTLASLRLGATLHLGIFNAFGCGLAAALAAMWLVVMSRTLHGGWKGHLFVSPCIASPN